MNNTPPCDDHRLTTCWTLAHCLADGDSVDTSHVLTAALLLDNYHETGQKDPSVWSHLKCSVRPGQSLDTLKSRLPDVNISECLQRAIEIPKLPLSSSLHSAVAEFQQAYRELSGDNSIALELLIGCVIPRLPLHFCEHWHEVDWQSAREAVQSHVGSIIAGRILKTALLLGIEAAFVEGTRQPEASSPEPVFDTAFQNVSERIRESGTTRTPLEGSRHFEECAESMLRIMHRAEQRHVLLVAEKGVGVSMAISELARRIQVGQVPFLNGCKVWSAHFRNLLNRPPAGAREFLAPALQPGNLLLLEGLGSSLSRDNVRALVDQLLGSMSQVRGRLIVAVSPWEHDELIAESAELLDHFDRVELSEPDRASAIKIVRQLADGLQHRCGFAIDDEVVALAVGLTEGYVLNEKLPGKALRVLSRICEDLDYERTQLRKSRDRVTGEDVYASVSKLSGIPQQTLRGIAEHVDYGRGLQEQIFGQDQATAQVAMELGLIKAGLTDPGKPASVMLFVGQTGTGKTELAKALAQFYSTSKRLRTYTLGNFVESHSVSGIIGVPAGYVGHDQGGRIVNELNSDPYSVFLLDEADKAHPDVLQPFLNLFDEGWIRDQKGVQARADRAIFVLTTNVGQRMIAEMHQQGKSSEEIVSRMKEALSQIRHGKSNRPVFAPEFLARIKRIVVFNPLNAVAMEQITQKQARELTRDWNLRRQKLLTISDPLLAHVARLAHEVNEKSDGKEGGRIVRKLMSELVESPLQRAISGAPEEYRNCSQVQIELSPSQEAMVNFA